MLTLARRNELRKRIDLVRKAIEKASGGTSATPPSSSRRPPSPVSIQESPPHPDSVPMDCTNPPDEEVTSPFFANPPPPPSVAPPAPAVPYQSRTLLPQSPVKPSAGVTKPSWNGGENWSGNNFTWRDEPLQILQKTFGYHGFRTNQREVINATLSGRDCFVLMPTGGGKSLTFQIPALIDLGLTIVISPLVSLIQDQVESFNASVIGHVAVQLSSTQSEAEKRSVQDMIRSQDECLRLLYLTPERVVKDAGLASTLKRMHHGGFIKRYAQ